MSGRLRWTSIKWLEMVLLITLVCFGRVDETMGEGGLVQTEPPTAPHVRWSWERGGSFNALDFPSSGVGWLGGELLVRGLRHADGSWTWAQMAPQATDRRSIKALDFLDERHGCALGDDHTFLYTAEKGYTWSVKGLPPGISVLSGVRMTGPETIHAIGRDTAQRGVILRSFDAGASWYTVYTTNHQAWLTDLVLFPGGQGIAVGYDWTQIVGYTGFVLRFDEDGAAETYIRHRLFPRALSTPDADHIYVAAFDDAPLGDPAGGAVLYSHDGGDSWSYVLLPSANGLVEPYDISFGTTSEGWVVGSSRSEEALLYRTTDSGVTWAEHTNFSERPERLNALDLIGGPDGTTLFALQSARDRAFPCNAGCSGVVVQSTDGGASWGRVEALSGLWAQQLSVAPQYTTREGLLLGRLGDDDRYAPYSPQRYAAGVILRSGQRRAPFSMPSNLADQFLDWLGLELVAEDEAWATVNHWEQEGKRWYTDDSGLTWESAIAPFSSRAGDLSAVSPHHAWSLDYLLTPSTDRWFYASRLLTTSDGGTWIERSVPLAAYPYDAPRLDGRVAMADQSHGCVLDEAYARTNCTGDGWATYSSHTLYCLGRDITMLDAQHGWILCYETDLDRFKVWRTGDGGATWSPIAVVNPGEVSAAEKEYTSYGYGSRIAFENTRTGWFAHHNIWETRDGGVKWERAFDGIHPRLGISLLDTGMGGTAWAASPSGVLLRRARVELQLPVFASGGELPSPDDGRFVVEFPPGAVLEDTLASLTVHRPGAAGDYIATRVYGLALVPAADLATPITLTLTIPPTTSAAQTINQDNGVLARWEIDGWDPLPDNHYDSQGRLTATSSQTGFFGLVTPSKRVYLPLILRR